MNDDHTGKFPGFPEEPIANFWQYPKALNGWWHALTGSEQKALDYLLRHTWGYRKNSDYISYSQFLHGIRRRKDGTWVDKGCGIKSQTTLRKALKGLEEKGFIETTKTGGRSNFYTLRITSIKTENGELLQKMENPSPGSGVVGTPENGDTIKNNTINNQQQINRWANKYGNEIKRLIKEFGYDQVDTSIRIMRTRSGIKNPIGYIKTLCRNKATWEDPPSVKQEMEMMQEFEKGNKYVQDAIYGKER